MPMTFRHFISSWVIVGHSSFPSFTNGSNSLKLRNRIGVLCKSCSLNPPMTKKNPCVIVQLSSLYLSEIHHGLNHWRAAQTSMISGARRKYVMIARRVLTTFHGPSLCAGILRCTEIQEHAKGWLCDPIEFELSIYSCFSSGCQTRYPVECGCCPPGNTCEKKEESNTARHRSVRRVIVVKH